MLHLADCVFFVSLAAGLMIQHVFCAGHQMSEVHIQLVNDHTSMQPV
jgi:hypothetical protein